MNKVEVVVDATQVEAMLKSLSGDDRKKAEKSALITSANILKRETIKEYKSKTNIGKISVTRTIRGGKNKGKRISRQKDIAATKWDKQENAAKVHIMSNPVTRFFEMGTRSRTTKGYRVTGMAQRRIGGRSYKVRTGKGGYRGQMKAQWIFKSVKQRVERKIFDEMSNRMATSIQRIAKKNAGN